MANPESTANRTEHESQWGDHINSIVIRWLVARPARITEQGRFAGIDQVLATHAEAEQRYDRLRHLALVSSQNALQADYPLLRLTGVDHAALTAFGPWQGHEKRRVDWDWFTGYGQFRFRYPKRFEAAIWHGSSLQGLSLGRPTYNGTALRLDFVEAAPLRREVAVFPILLVAMWTYADMLGAQEMRIMHPINDVVREYYASYGFTYVAARDYLYKRIWQS